MTILLQQNINLGKISTEVYAFIFLTFGSITIPF